MKYLYVRSYLGTKKSGEMRCCLQFGKRQVQKTSSLRYCRLYKMVNFQFDLHLAYRRGVFTVNGIYVDNYSTSLKWVNSKQLETFKNLYRVRSENYIQRPFLISCKAKILR